MNAVFICGTDTGVGKTIVTGLFAGALLDQGFSVITQKWVQTGSKGFPADIAAHLKLMGKKKSYVKGILDLVNPYCYDFPASPHLAAGEAGKRVRGAKIKKAFRHLTKMFDYVIVEGVGGALVPLNKKTLVIDVVKELKIPVLLVVGNKLGAINHALLTIEALKKRKIEITGFVFNNHQKTDKRVQKDNIDTICELSGIKNYGILPRIPS